MILRGRELARVLTGPTKFVGLFLYLLTCAFLFPYTLTIFNTANYPMTAILSKACKYQKLN